MKLKLEADGFSGESFEIADRLALHSREWLVCSQESLLPRQSSGNDGVETHGRSILIGSLSNSACSKVAPFVLENIGGLIAVASFGATWTLLGPLRMISGAINGILRPRLALYINSGNIEGFNGLLQLALISIVIVGSFGTLATAFIGPFLIEVLFDPSLRNAGFLLPLGMAYSTLDVVTTTQMIALQTKVK